MKKSGLITLLIAQLFLSQNSQTQNYQKIPDVFDTPENLYPFIKPSENMSYWKVFTNHSDYEKAVLYESQYPEPMTILEPIPERGFFQKCSGENCYHYIIACKNDRPEYFKTDNDLRKFIAEVDNIAEAVLIVNTYGFSIDINNAEGGSFKKDENNFYLKTFKSHKCPEVRESFLVTIERKNGQTTSQSNGIYSSKKSCE
ncbi:hypothetical protein [Chryseobacterium foetidum]|uniref:hypothetical protein n=1 Tax=Chryseobacterium foetidum TaxID=2951057 RepID=UPI0021C9FD19|nr:hypothetical protein [Chryseobacterium foetidum]